MAVGEYIKDNISQVYHLSMALTVVVLIALFLGTVPDKVSLISGRMRHSLGFNNINSAGLFFTTLCYLFLLSRGNSIKLVHWIIGLGVICLVYYYTNSRTMLYSMLAFFAMFYVCKCAGSVLLKNVIIFIEILFFMLPLIMILADKLLMEYNYLFSMRISIYTRYISGNSFLNLLFGRSNHGEIDNFYLMLLFSGGLIFYCFFAVLTIMKSVRFVKQGNFIVLSFLVAYLCYGLLESAPLRCEIPISILLWSIVFSEKGIVLEKEVIENKDYLNH